MERGWGVRVELSKILGKKKDFGGKNQILFATGWGKEKNFWGNKTDLLQLGLWAGGGGEGGGKGWR